MYKEYIKKIIVIIFVIAIVTLFSCSQETAVQKAAKQYLISITSDKATFNMTTFEAVLKRIEKNDENMLIVDMRKPSDYAAGHLPGAVNITYANIGKHMDRLPKDKDILVHCYSGQTSGQAIAAMRIMGFKAYTIKSGMTFGWTPLGLSKNTLETTSNPLPQPNNYNWSKEEEEVLEAIKHHFTQGTVYVMGATAVHKILYRNPLTTGVLDIRNDEVYQQSHVDRAILIPFIHLDKDINKIPKNKPVYMYCFSGQTAGQALLALRLYGFDIYSISRGMIGWASADLPVLGTSTGIDTEGGCN